MKNLHIVVDLPISQENEGLIQLVAISDGWTSNTLFQTGVAEDGAKITETITAAQFVTDIVIKKFLKEYISGKVSNAYGDYFGRSKDIEKKALTELVLEKLSVDVQFNEIANP